MAAGRALPVASITVTPAASAARNAAALEGSTRLLLSSKVPSMSSATSRMFCCLDLDVRWLFALISGALSAAIAVSWLTDGPAYDHLDTLASLLMLSQHSGCTVQARHESAAFKRSQHAGNLHMQVHSFLSQCRWRFMLTRVLRKD